MNNNNEISISSTCMITAEDSLNLYWSALKNRKTTDTGTNETSSRSHLITVISKFALKEDEDEKDVLINSLYFFDLCGQEKGKAIGKL
jgi:hypothetical protein